MLGALVLLLAGQVEPARTVNGDVLGAAADFRTTGPAKVCIRTMAVAAREGEAVYLGYAGIHSGTLRLVRGARYVDFTHGEIFVRPKKRLKLIEKREDGGVYRSVASPVRYAYLAPTETGRAPKPIVWVEGTALTGLDDDIGLIRRLTVSKDDATGCDRTYTYGWDMLFGDEVLSRKKDQ